MPLDDKFSSYVLTNYHVISSAIRVVEEWDGTLKIEADIVVYNRDEDVALLKTRSERCAEHVAILYPKDKQDDIHVFARTVGVGCSLGFPPIPTPGIITRKNFQVHSYEFWMSSSQIIYGNSGGAMFLQGTGEFIGIPSMVAVVGWSTPVTHMGLFIPIHRIYEWLEKEHYDFIYDETKAEKECLEEREKELKGKRKELEP